MEQKLKAERRTGTGKGAARKARAAGRVPGVVYGHGEPLNVSVDAKELFRILHSEAGANVLVDMRVDGDRFLAMPREIQRDLIKGAFLHVDFIRVARDEKVTVEVPVHIGGDARGVREGGVVEHHLWTVQVECLPQDVPGAIEADITNLGMNESLHVSDLRAQGGVAILTASDEVVVSVVTPQILRLEEEVPEELAEAEAAAEAEGAAEGAGAGEGAESAES